MKAPRILIAVFFAMCSLAAAQTLSPIVYTSSGTHQLSGQRNVPGSYVGDITAEGAMYRVMPSSGTAVLELSDSQFNSLYRWNTVSYSDMHGSLLGVYGTRNNATWDVLSDAALVLDNVSVTNNYLFSWSQSMGIIFFISTNTLSTIKNSTFANNSVVGHTQAWGGVVAAYGADNLSFENNVFRNNSVSATYTADNNTAIAQGGAIRIGSNYDYKAQSTASYVPHYLTISNTLFEGNEAVGIHASGGAVAGYGAKQNHILIENSTFTDNAVRITRETPANSWYLDMRGGGALILSDAVATFSATGGKHIVNSGNTAYVEGVASDRHGGFLMLLDYGNGGNIVNFEIDGASSMTIGQRGVKGKDSIATYKEDKSLADYTHGYDTAVINKIGKGLLVVNGSMEYYYGSVNVQQGRMEINGGLTAKNVQIASGAELSFGESVLVNEQFAIDASSTTEMYLESKSAHTQVLLADAAKVTIEDSATLNIILSNSFEALAGDECVLFLAEAGGSVLVTGEYDNVALSTIGGVAFVEGLDYEMLYDGESIVLRFLQDIPEPAASAAFLSLLILGVAARRRR